MRRELAELERRSQLRSLELAQDLDFSSNDYLGISVDPAPEAGRCCRACGCRCARGCNRFALALRPRRMLDGTRKRFRALDRHGSCAVFYVRLSREYRPARRNSFAEDTVFSDSANHASLIDGIRLSKARRVIFPHGDLNFLEDALRSDSATAGARFIVVESVFSMEGDRAPARGVGRACRAPRRRADCG